MDNTTPPRLVIVLDDERTFQSDEPVVYLRTANEALAWFAAWWTKDRRSSVYAPIVWVDELWLDHDLGEGEDATIVVDFLYSLNEHGGDRVDPLPIRKVIVHSQNPVGARNLARKAKGICGDVTIPMGLPDPA